MPTSHPHQLEKAGADRRARSIKKRISDDEWLVHKDTIGRLYLDEGRDVREVRDTMKREFDFDAHEKAYKRKFEEWGLIKNIPKDEGLFMVKKRELRREAEGKETIFRRRRRADGPLQLVLDEKVDRIADRYSHDLNNFPRQSVSTPENIQYDTPDGTPEDEIPRKIKSESLGPSSGSEWAFNQVPVPNNDQYYGNDGSQARNGLLALPHLTAMSTMTTMNNVNATVQMTGHPNPHANPNMNGGMHGNANANGTWDPWSTNGYF